MLVSIQIDSLNVTMGSPKTNSLLSKFLGRF